MYGMPVIAWKRKSITVEREWNKNDKEIGTLICLEDIYR